jgi:hypothetical protein
MVREAHSTRDSAQLVLVSCSLEHTERIENLLKPRGLLDFELNTDIIGKAVFFEKQSNNQKFLKKTKIYFKKTKTLVDREQTWVTNGSNQSDTSCTKYCYEYHNLREILMTPLEFWDSKKHRGGYSGQ